MENRIKSERAQMQLSQEDLAKRLGVHPNTLQKWEKDMSHCPLAQAVSMAHIFGCSLEWLIGRAETRC